MKWEWRTLIYFLKLIAHLHCGVLERQPCWLENEWEFVIRWWPEEDLNNRTIFCLSLLIFLLWWLFL